MTVYSQGLMDSRQEKKVLHDRISGGFSKQSIPGVSGSLTEQFTPRQLRVKNRKFKKQ